MVRAILLVLALLSSLLIVPGVAAADPAAEAALTSSIQTDDTSPGEPLVEIADEPLLEALDDLAPAADDATLELAADPAAGASATAARVTRATWKPASVRAGKSSRLEVKVKAATAGTRTIEVVVRDPGHQIVWQNGWANQTFRRSQTRTFRASWPVPAGVAGGPYTTTVRVLDMANAEAAPARQATLRVTGTTPAPPPATGLEPEEATFLTLINQYRQSKGLAPLRINQSLLNAAGWHSNDMATKRYFSHTDSLGRDPFQRMAAFGYTANTYKGENIAAGYGTAAAVLAGWKGSPGHNANMLNPRYTVIGIGFVQLAGSPYGAYWTTAFGGQ